MASGWSVASSAALGASVGLLLVGAPEGPQADAAHPLVLLLAAALYATWAYALVDAAHGTKGALVPLLVLGALWCALPGGALLGLRATGGGASWVELTMASACLALGLLAAWGAWTELRRRRGAIQWGAALLPLVPFVLLFIVFASMSLR